MFIKICGLATPEAVAAAVAAGADAIGFILAPGYERTVTPETVRALIAGAGAVETVAVFRDQPLDVVLTQARAAGVATVQLHGSEGEADVAALERAGFGVLRAFAAEDFAGLDAGAREFWRTRRILLDAPSPGAGRTFDPGLLAAGRPEGQWLLAGGLDAGNVAELTRELSPSGVDVSSGVEVRRGVKSPALITEFIETVRAIHPPRR